MRILLNISHVSSAGAYVFKLDSTTIPLIQGEDCCSKLKAMARTQVSDNFSIETITTGDLLVVPDNTSIGLIAALNQLILLWEVVSLATLARFVQAYIDTSSKNR